MRTSPGYKEAYQKFIEGGWISLSCDPKYGGQGMPKTVSTFFDEMLSSTCLAFKLYSELTIGAYNCILRHANDEIKNKYLPKMVEGKWSGTMCLTEPVCGTDLGLLKTKAEKQSDGTYKLSGQKIFITSGDQDLTENIIHLVIARAGASTIAELLAAGRPSILVPYPHAMDNHQTENATAIQTLGGCWLLNESEFTVKTLADLLCSFFHDFKTLQRVAAKSKLISTSNATESLDNDITGIATKTPIHDNTKINTHSFTVLIY